jgi:oligopeptidase B
MKSIPIPPKAKKIPYPITKHGHTRTDNYFWLSNREDEGVISHLNAENDYLEQVMEPFMPLRDKLYEEITNRIKQDDESVPYFKKGFFYYTRYEPEKEYPVYCRKKGSIDSEEEVLLNVNLMATGQSYYDVKGLSLSPNSRFLAYGLDTLGRRIYQIFLKDLDTGEIIDTGIGQTTGVVSWANDSNTIFYTRKDNETLRSYQIIRKKLFPLAETETVVFEEDDDTFVTGVYKTKSEKYIVIGSHSSLSDEYRILEADAPDGAFRLFHPREREMEYSISHIGNKFYICTNWQAENFRLMEVDGTGTGKEKWKEVLPHRCDVLIENICVFSNFLVIGERVNAQQRLRIIKLDGTDDHYIEIEEEAYSIYVSVNPEFDTHVLRFGYFSLTTPSSVFDYNMDHRTMTLLKQQEILGGFDKTHYKSKRLFAIAPDGEEIPISMVYHKKTDISRPNPLLLYAYGSYGHTVDPYFSIARLSLLDRGFIFAIAHVRGGEIKGRRWYKEGKMLKKMNTFTDYIACAQYLTDEKYSAPNKLYALGGSAGGLLVGAVANLAPQLFNGIIAAVPFVDVCTTMLDSSIPLTTGEYDEWGNPEEKEYYDYILSYSPYDNVKQQDYPSMLVTTGLHDPLVQYWEPAKWVAKLREMKTDNNLLLLYIDMDSGHSGSTGRFKSFKDTALEYAYLLKLEGINQ